MSKITSEHLARAAYIYVRQSTAYQVVNNLESQRRQYGLVERARSIRWRDGPARIRETTGRDLRRQGWRSGIAGSLAPCAERA